MKKDEIKYFKKLDVMRVKKPEVRIFDNKEDPMLDKLRPYTLEEELKRIANTSDQLARTSRVELASFRGVNLDDYDLDDISTPLDSMYNDLHDIQNAEEKIKASSSVRNSRTTQKEAKEEKESKQEEKLDKEEKK